MVWSPVLVPVDVPEPVGTPITSHFNCCPVCVIARLEPLANNTAPDIAYVAAPEFNIVVDCPGINNFSYRIIRNIIIVRAPNGCHWSVLNLEQVFGSHG